MLEPWQFRLTATPHPNAQPLGAFYYSVGPDLQVTEVFDNAGQAAGVLLGHPIDLAKKEMIGDAWPIPADTDLATDTGIAKTLLALGGAFLWICLNGKVARIYPDASAQVSCVYDRSQQSAGATTMALLNEADYAARFDHALFARLGLVGEGWFPAGLTAHSGVMRLLPNHYLDLHAWKATRFDITQAMPSNPNPDMVVDRMIATIQNQLAATMKGPKPPVLALTAGYETRALLACARAQVNDLSFVTVIGEDRHRTDSEMASKIAGALGLHHIKLPRIEADRTAQELYLRRGGHCCGDSNMRYHPSIRPLADDFVFLGGLGGEIGRGFYWYDDDTPEMNVDAAMLLSRMGMRGNEKTKRYMQIWLDGVRDLPADRILDLAYLENRMGPWAYAQHCADPTLVRFAPMITYETVSLMHALPMEWKQTNRLNREIIARQWPELDGFPYNTLGPMKDLVGKIQRIWDDPALVVRHMRRRA